MSGHSSSTTCPNCGKDADAYSDYKPFNYESTQCPYCGLLIFPFVSYMDLDVLNEFRYQCNLKPLKKLPKQEFQY